MLAIELNPVEIYGVDGDFNRLKGVQHGDSKPRGAGTGTGYDMVFQSAVSLVRVPVSESSQSSVQTERMVEEVLTCGECTKLIAIQAGSLATYHVPVVKA